jgi:hypothetical protein
MRSVSIEYVSGIPWQERERLFDAGEIQILWLCGRTAKAAERVAS